MNIDFDKVSEKNQRLETIRRELKNDFFGIDTCIDKVIDSVKTWYLMPEIVTRPVIVCVWGLTGVGKTALIRSLVKKLDFQNHFVEIQMDGISNGTSNNENSIRAILQSSSIQENEQGIVLLDEYQRFRTIDEHGKDVKVERYADVWMLLSDGCFPNDYTHLHRLQERFTNYEYIDDLVAADRAIEELERQDELEDKSNISSTETDGPKKDGRENIWVPTARRYASLSKSKAAIALLVKRKFFLEQSDAKSLKEALRSKESVREIMTWEADKVREIVKKAIESKSNPPINYSKCLIFVSGNLDEAYQMSGDIEDCDTSADIFKEHTSKIGIVEIKSALARRFKPEQIARLGNNHIIYPSLGTDAYMAIIKRACEQYIEEANKICDVKFNVSQEVYKEIYENSVYPTQGTRPVFTSVHKMFGHPISDAILWALSNNINNVEIGLDIANSSIVFRANGQEKRVHVDLEIRARRAAYSGDFNALVAVHEAGHAIIYADLFKMAPVEVAISMASFRGGYNRFKSDNPSKREMLDKIVVGMGGIVAEEIIFGPDLRSTGCASDISKVTEYATSYVRRYAMDGSISRIASEMPNEISSNTNVEDSNSVVEQLLKDRKEQARNILNTHRETLILLSKHLLKVKKMNAADFIEFMKGRIELQPFVDKDINGDYLGILERL